MAEHDDFVNEHDDFVNEILEHTDDDWDGDDAAEEIAIRYVRHLESEVTRLNGSFYPYESERE